MFYHKRMSSSIDTVKIVLTTRFLNNTPELLGDKADKSIQELGLVIGTEKLIKGSFGEFSNLISKVQSESLVVSVLPTLFKYRVSAAAIVDEQGKIVGNFSASDLRILTVDNFHKIYELVSSFLDLVELKCNANNF